jgi:phosphoesterase RecJ-like protein
MTTHTTEPSFSTLDAWLAGKKRILLLTHERPDGDAVGSLCGATMILAAAGFDCTAFLKQPVPRRYTHIPAPAPAQLRVGSLGAAAVFDGILCLDSARLDRVDFPPELKVADSATLPLCNLDHHADNERFGGTHVILPQMAATAQLLLNYALSRKLEVPAAAASWLLSGLVMDTGAFRFTNTSAAVLRDAAALVECGAEYSLVMDGLFNHEPLARRLLAARLLETAEFHFGGALLLSQLQPGWLEEFGVAGSDTEGLIDALRVIDGVEISAMIQKDGANARISLRARSERTPVDEIAHALGGGGHRLASGIKMKDTTMDAARTALLAEAGKMLGKPAEDGKTEKRK